MRSGMMKVLKLLPISTVSGFVGPLKEAYGVQLHLTSEGIITHQMGHLFFLASMVVLIFTLAGKELDRQKSWRRIQYSAFFFILWNICALLAHFLDNQLHVVSMEALSMDRVRVTMHNDSSILLWVYYLLKLDHLLAVPAMLFFLLGLSCMATDQKSAGTQKEDP